MTIKTGAISLKGSENASLTIYDNYMGLRSGDAMMWLGNSVDSYITDGKSKLQLGATTYLKGENGAKLSLSGSSTHLDLSDETLVIDGNTCSKNRKVTISWLGRTPYFMVYKGLVIDDSTTAGDSATDEEGGLGELAFMDEVVVSSANFSLGTVESSEVSGDTATYTVTIPGQKYTAGSSGTKTVYAYKNAAGNVYTTTSSTPMSGYSYADSTTVTAGSSGSGTTDDRTLTVTITVAAQKKET
jgi:hypothetical protein